MSLENVGGGVRDISAPRTETVTIPENLEGLDQVQGTRELTPPEVRSGRPDIRFGSDGLHEIQHGKAQMDLVTRSGSKSTAVLRGLPPDIQKKFETRLQAMDKKEISQVKDLLHFAMGKRGKTTEDTRMDIRKALASFIAQGGSIEDAGRLRSGLMAMPNGLPQEVRENLATRMQGMDQEQMDAVKDLFHFAYNKRGNTTSQSRVDIRKALAGFLVRGGTIENAHLLKIQLKTVAPDKLAQLSTDINTSDIPPSGALAKALIDPDAQDPKARFQAVKDLILGFPDKPENAGKYEYVDSNVSISRDANGKLTFGNLSARLVRIGGDTPYPTLTKGQVGQIKQLFSQVVGAKYSRMGIPLDMMGAFQSENMRRSQSGESPVTLNSFMKTWQADGGSAVDRYGRGDCISLGEKLVSELGRQNFKGYLAGYYNRDLTRQRVGGDVRYLPDDALQTGRMTHSDVLVPYTDENGKERVLLLTPGMGNEQPEKWFKDLEPSDPNLDSRRIRIGSGVEGSPLQKAQLGFLTNLQMTNNEWGKSRQVFGIDLVEGKLYLNSGATEKFRAKYGPNFGSENESISFSYRDVLAHPRDPVTVKLWDRTLNEGQGGYKDKTVTRLDSMALFLMAVRDEFEQTNDFVFNTLSLLGNEDSYKQDVLWQSVQTVHGMND